MHHDPLQVVVTAVVVILVLVQLSKVRERRDRERRQEALWKLRDGNLSKEERARLSKEYWR